MKYNNITSDVILGKNVILANFLNLYGCNIGENTKIGSFVEIQKGVQIGRNCKISSHSFICEGVIIEDNVFIGHNVSFINDPLPRSTNSKGNLQTENDWKIYPTIIRKGASIGSGATVLCNIIVEKNSIIGAGSVVTRNIPESSIFAGNPARLIRELNHE